MLLSRLQKNWPGERKTYPERQFGMIFIQESFFKMFLRLFLLHYRITICNSLIYIYIHYSIEVLGKQSEFTVAWKKSEEMSNCFKLSFVIFSVMNFTHHNDLK
mmetsp:Transcript_16225/g.32306  ORF Transcript_16225/g.32306 Transcript_16225/m.32306 type:complete len:103 (+) Transcript_16225:87-395(+)